jgi:hypothetical protein
MASFMSHDAAHGALPTLRAATALDVASGSYVAPSRLFHLKGEPVLVQVPKPARDETLPHSMGGFEEADRCSFRGALVKLE